jgi:hypothetical protein
MMNRYDDNNKLTAMNLIMNTVDELQRIGYDMYPVNQGVHQDMNDLIDFSGNQ